MYKILIIEDSKALAERLQLVLQQEGYEVYIASNGYEGLKVIKSMSPDLVITDILMPVMDGFEVIIYLKKHNPEIQIVAMTSGGYIKANEYLHTMRQFGVDSTLMKPFRDDYLKNIVFELKEKKIDSGKGKRVKVS
jgi:CheY-like chemotaxis protein